MRKNKRREKVRIGLVLEGGAMRGLYTAGVLDAFLEKNIKVSEIIGVSAGVLFGVNYLSKQKGRVLRYNKKYAKDKRYMGFRSLITTGNIINKDFAYYEIPSKLDIFDEEEYEKSHVPFYAVVTNVDSGEAEYIRVEKPMQQMELLRATSAMPFVSKIVKYEGKNYLDGGIADSIPIDRALSMGFDRIIVVLTRPIEYRKKQAKGRLAKVFYRKYPKLVHTIKNRYLNYNSSVEKVIDLENKKEIFVIRPSKKIDIKRTEKDENKLEEMYNLGLHDAENLMGSLIEYLT